MAVMHGCARIAEHRRSGKTRTVKMPVGLRSNRQATRAERQREENKYYKAPVGRYGPSTLDTKTGEAGLVIGWVGVVTGRFR